MLSVSIWSLISYFSNAAIGETNALLDNLLTVFSIAVFTAFVVFIFLLLGIIGVIKCNRFRKTAILAMALLVLCWACLPVTLYTADKIYYSLNSFSRTDETVAEQYFSQSCEELENLSEKRGDTLEYRKFLKKVPRPTALDGYSNIVITNGEDNDISLSFIYLEDMNILSVEVSYLLDAEKGDKPDWGKLEHMLEYYNSAATLSLGVEECRLTATDSAYVVDSGEGYTQYARALDDNSYIRCRVFESGGCRLELHSIVSVS